MVTTRDVIGATAYKTSTNSSSQSQAVLLDWNVLEQNDGIKLQVIYGGNVSEPVVVDGVIEGQKQGISRFEKGTPLGKRLIVQFVLLAIATNLLTFLCMILVKSYQVSIPKFWLIRVLPIFLIIVVAISVLMFFFYKWLATPVKTPFDL
jgi:hypothetical protein